MPTVRCPGCDDGIEIEPDWYGRKVACPTCEYRFTPRRPGRVGADDEPDPPAGRRRAREGGEGEEDRPRKRKRRERPLPMSRGMRQLILFGSIGGGILLCCLGCVGWLGYQIWGPMDYSVGWTTQSLEDGSYSAQFPRSPKEDTPSGVAIGGRGKTYVVLEKLPNDAVFALSVFDDPPQSFDEAYAAIRSEILDRTQAKVSREGAVTAAGCSGQEVDLAAGPTKLTVRLLDASRNGRRRYLLMMAGGRNVSDADRRKFLDSLKSGGK